MRKAPIITKEELEARLDEKIKDKFPYEISATVKRDLSKVEFDWENYELEETAILSNGLPVKWGWAGGDWENPVKFVLYWDGKKLRGYIPTRGNLFNTRYMSAYGNHDDSLDDYGSDEAAEYHQGDMERDILERIQII